MGNRSTSEQKCWSYEQVRHPLRRASFPLFNLYFKLLEAAREKKSTSTYKSMRNAILL